MCRLEAETPYFLAMNTELALRIVPCPCRVWVRAGAGLADSCLTLPPSAGNALAEP